MIGNVPGGDEKLMLDTTGAFHWCPNQTLERCTLDGEQVERKLTTLPLVNLIHDQVSKKNFRNHVIVGVIADKDSSVLGLKNLIMPLRASNIRLETESHTWTSNCYSY